MRCLSCPAVLLHIHPFQESIRARQPGAPAPITALLGLKAIAETRQSYFIYVTEVCSFNHNAYDVSN